MPDIGFGEIVVIVVIALLVFGPDRLPKVAADAARTLRQVRQMAANARQDLVDASGLDEAQDVSQALRDLDPRRAATGLTGDGPGSGRSRGGNGRIRPDSTAPQAKAAGSGGAAAKHPAEPVAPPVIDAAPVDPDWT